MYFSNASVRVIPCRASSSLPLRFMVPSSLSDVVSLGFAYIPASFPAAPPVSHCASCTCVGAAARPKAVFGAFWKSAAAGGD